MEAILDEYVGVIRAEISNGNLKEALRLIRVRKTGRYETPFLKVQALLCIAAEEYDAAKKFLVRAREQNPEDMELYVLLTECYTHGEGSVDSYGSVNIIDTSNDQSVSYTDVLDLYANRRTASRQGVSEGAPLVSIYFLAYNNLEKYTKPSIEALLRHTADVDYELILVDNGSSDGTLSYFEQIPFEKKRIYRISDNKGAGYGYIAASRFCRGKFFRGQYIAMLPQDVIVTRNWLKNLLCCMESDSKIGMAVPFSDYVSNCQDVDLAYTDMEDMQQKAAIFNRPDPAKWEERLRLIPTTYIIRAELWDIYQADPAFVYNFMDDDQCYTYRHLGYRLMACGDTFVHHGGHVGFQDPEKLDSDVNKGRAIFSGKYRGIDAWRDTMNFDVATCRALLSDIQTDAQLSVLGVDVRCGAPLLTLKNQLRADGTAPELAAYTRDAKYYADLQTVLGDSVYCGDTDRILQKCRDHSYDIVMVGEDLSTYDDYAALLDDLIELLKPGGRISVKLRRFPDLYDVERLLSRMEHLPPAQEGMQQVLCQFLTERHISFEMIELPPDLDSQFLWDNMDRYLKREDHSPAETERLQRINFEHFLSVTQEYCFIIRGNEQ